MELFLLYIWLMLGYGVVASFIIALCAADAEEVEIAKLWIKTALALSVMAILVGANYALKAAETPEAQKVMTILRAKANEILDAEIKEQVK